MNGYQPNYYGMYGTPTGFQQPMRYQPEPQQYTPPQPAYKQPIGLQGKSVDSVDVVKAMDIPLDGSVSYFPLTDGSAIVTKQLQMDGSSKTIVYKPTETEEPKQTVKYITDQQLDDAMKKVDNKDLKEDIKAMKRQIKDLVEDIKEINENISRKD